MQLQVNGQHNNVEIKRSIYNINKRSMYKNANIMYYLNLLNYCTSASLLYSNMNTIFLKSPIAISQL